MDNNTAYYGMATVQSLFQEIQRRAQKRVPPKPRYTINVQHPPGDPYPNNFKCWVSIFDNMSNKHYMRRGYGKFVGNFSPIWVTLNGERKQLSELERETYGPTVRT